MRITASTYVRALRAALPAETFARATSRILWLPVHVAIIASAVVMMATHRVPWPLFPLVSLIVGTSFAGLAFLGHETLHGAVVRGRRTRHVIGWIAFSPFVLSPRLWTAWHNREHHGNTNRVGHDPDMYPVLRAYQEASAVERAVTDAFALGGRRWTGVFSLLVGFNGQSGHMLFTARRRGWMSRRQELAAFAETGLGLVMWLAIGWRLGVVASLFTLLLPLVIANVWVMAFILTNHGLSPLGDVNDPLVNSLSVTVPRPIEWLTLGFGYHVEHHLFPAMSTRHAPRVRDELERRWPERYQSMPLATALRRLHVTARIYADDVTLVDPPSGRTWPTLLPRVPDHA